MTDTIPDTLTPGVHSPTTDPACGVQRDFGEHNDDGTHVCNDGPGHFVLGRPHACRCSYQWAAAGQPTEPTEEEYDAAVETLVRVYRGDADELISMIETTRDEEIVHDSMVTGGDVHGPTIECAEGCVGCMTERIADAVTRAVNGKAA